MSRAFATFSAPRFLILQKTLRSSSFPSIIPHPKMTSNFQQSMFRISITTLLVACLSQLTFGQTFQRLGGCPTLGCILPPDQASFLAGQYFDIRLEVHAPVNGSEAGNGIPDDRFTFTVQKDSDAPLPAAAFFKVAEPALERWNFTWYEDLFALDAKKPSLVNVTAKAYRKLQLSQPGSYTARLNYNNGSTTTARWHVRNIPRTRRAKNVVLFIGDGMTTNMITAARLLSHKSINGMDSFITDSANSATALYSGHKSTVNCLGVYADSSASKFDDPKIESVAEIFQRVWAGAVGIVSTAFLADATPAALTAHTRDRSQYGFVIDSFLNGVSNYTWGPWKGPDVLFGGGAENFYNTTLGGSSYLNKDYYSEFIKKGYNLALNNTQLSALSNSKPALGVFSVSNMKTWLDRNVYTNNLKNSRNNPDGSKSDALNQPGLLQMTTKAVEIANTRAAGKGFFVMSEAASIDKQMHALDYDRALGELLELDDTIRGTITKLKDLGILNDTLIIVTSDHGHGFDVTGSVDTKYLNEQKTPRAKRNAVGVYERSGLSQYVDGNLTYSTGVHFPGTWDPRYTLQQGVVTFPDHRENYQVHQNGSRVPAVNTTVANDNYEANPSDNPNGFIVNGTLPVDTAQGVHSLTDVAVFAMGPGQELFGGTYNNIDIFFKISEALGLSGR